MELIDVDEKSIVWYGCRPCQKVIWFSLLEEHEALRSGESVRVDFDGYAQTKYSSN